MIETIHKTYPALAHVLCVDELSSHRPSTCRCYLDEHMCPFLVKTQQTPPNWYCTLVHDDIYTIIEPKCSFPQWQDQAIAELDMLIKKKEALEEACENAERELRIELGVEDPDPERFKD